MKAEHEQSVQYLLRPMGDHALLVRLFTAEGLLATITQEQRYRLMLAARLLAAQLSLNAPQLYGGPTEFVPGYDSVLVPYEPSRLSQAVLEKWLQDQLEQALTNWRIKGLKDNSQPRHHRLPVIYGGQYGPDLEAISKRNNLTPAEVIRLHSQAEYTVYLIGFAPGFAYMGALSPELDAPRLERPRPQVPAGSVAIAAGLTGVYPLTMPGGWNLLGYTPWPLFDPNQEPPVRFLPGDRVRFYSIEQEALDELKKSGASLAPLKEQL
ncbi:MAG TPA: 5-oxoprolinase subunit PxpB [Chloroflexia bacterium]|nr:5-oxoprolinase subunit PxpB [Chloroflexia bacterium]